MNKLHELREALEALGVEIQATREQHELSRQACEAAATKGDREGVTKHTQRMKECEAHLRKLRADLVSIEYQRSEYWKEFVAEASIEEIAETLEILKEALDRMPQRN